MKSYLAGIPAPLPCESLTSWIQRVCQVYDLTFRRFHETFGTQHILDADLCMTSKDVIRIAQMCRLPMSSFELLRICFCKFSEKPALRHLLLLQENRLPLYRFCIACWAADRTPFLRLEWRFKAWAHCPVHRTPLNDKCPHCQKPLAMHRAVLGGTVDPAPVHNLAICLYCRHDLRQKIAEGIVGVVGAPELDAKIAFQRAVVSAVLHGYFHIEPFDERFDLTELANLIDGVGLDVPDEKTSQILNRMDNRDRDTLYWILNDARRNASWLNRGSPTRKNLARAAFEIWQSTRDMT